MTLAITPSALSEAYVIHEAGLCPKASSRCHAQKEEVEPPAGNTTQCGTEPRSQPASDAGQGSDSPSPCSSESGDLSPTASQGTPDCEQQAEVGGSPARSSSAKQPGLQVAGQELLHRSQASSSCSNRGPGDELAALKPREDDQLEELLADNPNRYTCFPIK